MGLLPIELRLKNGTAYPIVVTDHVHPVVGISSRITCHVTEFKSWLTGFLLASEQTVSYVWSDTQGETSTGLSESMRFVQLYS